MRMRLYMRQNSGRNSFPAAAAETSRGLGGSAAGVVGVGAAGGMDEHKEDGQADGHADAAVDAAGGGGAGSSLGAEGGGGSSELDVLRARMAQRRNSRRDEELLEALAASHEEAGGETEASKEGAPPGGPLRDAGASEAEQSAAAEAQRDAELTAAAADFVADDMLSPAPSDGEDADTPAPAAEAPAAVARQGFWGRRAAAKAAKRDSQVRVRHNTA